MNQGLIQQIGTPVDIYNEPENAFVADFIGESNIIDGVMPKDFLVEILGIPFPCVDSGFGRNELVDVVILSGGYGIPKAGQRHAGRQGHFYFVQGCAL